MKEWIWIISLIGSIGAIGAALAAWKAAKETRKTTLAQLLIQITNIYSSPKMLKAINLLNRERNFYGSNFAEEFAKLRENNTPQFDERDGYRRICTHYFHKIRLLLDSKIIDENFIQVVVSANQVNFLLETLEPLEKAINPNYDTSTFDLFRKIYTKSENSKNCSHYKLRMRIKY